MRTLGRFNVLILKLGIKLHLPNLFLTLPKNDRL